MRKSSARAEIGDLDRPFQRQRTGHDLAVNRSQSVVGKWARIYFAEPFHDFGFPGRSVEIRLCIGCFFQLADFDDVLGPFVE